MSDKENFIKTIICCMNRGVTNQQNSGLRYRCLERNKLKVTTNFIRTCSFLLNEAFTYTSIHLIFIYVFVNWYHHFVYPLLDQWDGVFERRTAAINHYFVDLLFDQWAAVCKHRTVAINHNFVDLLLDQWEAVWEHRTAAINHYIVDLLLDQWEAVCEHRTAAAGSAQTQRPRLKILTHR